MKKLDEIAETQAESAVDRREFVAAGGAAVLGAAVVAAGSPLSAQGIYRQQEGASGLPSEYTAPAARMLWNLSIGRNSPVSTP